MFNIVHLYPDELNLYGDTGNILFIQKILLDCGITSKVYKVSVGDPFPKKVDLIMVGGGPDYLQSIIYKDFLQRKDFLKSYFDSEKPSLFVCGSFQLLGKYYLSSTGEKIPGLGLFNFYTKSPDNQKNRIVGNINLKNTITKNWFSNYFVGFENHNGRTYLSKEKSFGLTLNKLYGNNTNDFTEGFIYKKTVGTYLHGPILVKNPHLAVFLLESVLPSNLVVKKFVPQWVAHKNALDLKR